MEVMLGKAVVPKRPGRRPSLINKYTVPGIPNILSPEFAKFAQKLQRHE